MNAEEYFERGNAYYNKGQYDKAVADYNKAIELNPEYAVAYNNRGFAYNSKGQYDKAIEDYSKAIELNPKGAIAYNNRGLAYFTKGQYDKAIEDYNKAIELNSKYAIAYYNRGLAYGEKGQYDKEIEDYSKAIELNPKYAIAYNNRGFAYDNKGQYDKAIEDYNKAIELAPKDARYYNNRGLAYFTKGQYDKAIADCSKAIEINPKYELAYYCRGNSYDNKGQYDKAIEDYNKAIEINPKSASAYFNRGFAYYHKGEYDKAIEDYNKAIELNPKYAYAYNNRGFAYYHKGEYDKAIEDYNKAIELDPKYAYAYYNRGFAYDNKGQYDKAIEDFNKAIEIDPKDASAYFNRGLVYKKLENYTKALADYKKAAELGQKDAAKNITEVEILIKKNSEVTTLKSKKAQKNKQNKKESDTWSTTAVNLQKEGRRSNRKGPPSTREKKTNLHNLSTKTLYPEKAKLPKGEPDLANADTNNTNNFSPRMQKLLTERPKPKEKNEDSKRKSSINSDVRGKIGTLFDENKPLPSPLVKKEKDKPTTDVKTVSEEEVSLNDVYEALGVTSQSSDQQTQSSSSKPSTSRKSETASISSPKGTVQSLKDRFRKMSEENSKVSIPSARPLTGFNVGVFTKPGGAHKNQTQQEHSSNGSDGQAKSESSSDKNAEGELGKDKPITESKKHDDKTQKEIKEIPANFDFKGIKTQVASNTEQIKKLSGISADDLAKIKSKIPALENISESAKGQFNYDITTFYEKLSLHRDELAQLSVESKSKRKATGDKESLLRGDSARKYYSEFISDFTSAYLAAKTISSGYVKPSSGKVGSIGETVKVVSGLFPVVGGLGKILGVLLKKGDEKYQKSCLDKLADICGTITDMDKIAENVALALIKNGRKSAEADLTKILGAIFEGSINSELDIQEQLVELVVDRKEESVERPVSPIAQMLQQNSKFTSITTANSDDEQAEANTIMDKGKEEVTKEEFDRLKDLFYEFMNKTKEDKDSAELRAKKTFMSKMGSVLDELRGKFGEKTYNENKKVKPYSEQLNDHFKMLQEQNDRITKLEGENERLRDRLASIEGVLTQKGITPPDPEMTDVSGGSLGGDWAHSPTGR